jgi:hypothetical protein
MQGKNIDLYPTAKNKMQGKNIDRYPKGKIKCKAKILTSIQMAKIFVPDKSWRPMRIFWE